MLVINGLLKNKLRCDSAAGTPLDEACLLVLGAMSLVNEQLNNYMHHSFCGRILWPV
jgi:hypothetical protein